MSEGLQVIGAGLHRTGGLSVKVALERLGFGPCYHGMEAMRRNADGEHWLAAYETGGDIDWSLIFDGYRATLDWPSIYFWERLVAAYPDAKVLLAGRDRESWWESHLTMFRLGFAFMDGLTDEEKRWAEESGFARIQAAMGTISVAYFDGRITDKEHCLRVFDRHYDRVRQIVPAERLLEYRVQDGWEPLCRFLGADVPDEPFPRVNVGDDLVRNIRTAVDQARRPVGEAIWR